MSERSVDRFTGLKLSTGGSARPVDQTGSPDDQDEDGRETPEDEAR